MSFATPPSLEVRGGRLAFEGYVPERRAIRLVAEGREIAITIRPAVPCINPVFEIDGAPGGELRVLQDGRPLPRSRYTWDGRTLWLDGSFTRPTELRATFGPPE